MEGYQWGGEVGRMGEKVQGIRSISGRYKIDRRRLRIVWENGEAKELICMTHVYKLRVWGDGSGGYRD